MEKCHVASSGKEKKNKQTQTNTQPNKGKLKEKFVRRKKVKKLVRNKRAGKRTTSI